jgi:hypothetical protein
MTHTHDKDFEADAEPYGYDLTMGNAMEQFIRGDVPYVYHDNETNHRWLGWLAASEKYRAENERLRKALTAAVSAMRKSVTCGATDHLDCCEDAGDFWYSALDKADQALAQQNGEK